MIAALELLCFYKWGWFRILCQWSNQCRIVNVHKCNNDGLFSELFIAIWSFIFHSYGQVWFIYNCAQSMLLCTISYNGCVLFTFFNIELYKYLDICFTYIISRNCFSLREPTESPTLVQARSSARKINKKSLNFLTDQTSWGLQDCANWRPQFLFCCLVLWLVYYLLIGWCYLSGAGLGGVSPCLLDRFVSSSG